MKLTKTMIEKLPIPEKGQTFYRDNKLLGFALRVTATGARSFVIEKRIQGALKRYTLGRYPNLTAEQARRQAQIELGKIAQGVNPVLERQSNQTRLITLSQAYDDYRASRKTLKPKTLQDYNHIMRHHLTDWLKKPLRQITKTMIVDRHRRIGEDYPAAANLTMRLIRAIFNYAIANYEDDCGNAVISTNPVIRLSQTRAWYRINRRDTLIKAHELPKWYAALRALTGHHGNVTSAMLIQDYLLCLLFTGLRRREAASLRWEKVDLQARTLTIENTKNNSTHTLPLSEYLYDLFGRRKAALASNIFVFPASSRSGHLEEPRKGIEKIIKLSGIPFTVHDLRRTFITIAESLDIPVYALKHLLNHKMSADVTAGYIVMDVERLRAPMQKITDYLLKCMGVIDGTPVVPINSGRECAE